MRARAAFTVGMFSLLDALLDQPMAKVLETLPLGVESKQALLGGSGELGELLAAVVAYEHGDWAAVEARLGEQAPVRAAFLEAVSWVDGVMRDLAQA
jgi:c-di-GMP phosphodiesterase